MFRTCFTGLSLALLATRLLAQSGSDIAPLLSELAIESAVESQPLPAPEPISPGVAEAGAASLGIPDLESLALANSPALSRAAAQVEAARGGWLQVGLPPNPTAGYAAAEIGDSGKAGQQGFYFGQEFVRGGKLRLNRAVAAQEIRQAEQTFAAERLRVLTDVRTAFFEMLVAQRTVELATELVRIGEQGQTMTEQLLRGEQVGRADFLQARIEANSARILADNALNRQEAAWQRLAAVVGMPQLARAVVIGDLEAEFEPLGWDQALLRLRAASPEIGGAVASVDRARWAVLRARAEPVPNVDLQLLGQYDNATGNGIAGVQATMPLPVLNRNQGGIRRAQAEISAAESELRRIELALQFGLAEVFERYANAERQVGRYRQAILPDAQETLSLNMTSYRNGQTGFLSVLTAQRTFFQTNLAYLEALRQRQESRVLIEGMLLTGSMDLQ